MLSFGDNLVVIVAIVSYAAYAIIKLYLRPDPYEELKQLNELRERGVITQTDYDKKKKTLLDD